MLIVTNPQMDAHRELTIIRLQSARMFSQALATTGGEVL